MKVELHVLNLHGLYYTLSVNLFCDHSLIDLFCFFICSNICWADHEIARTVTRRYKSLSNAVSLGNAPVFVTFLKLQFIASIALLTYITCLTAWPWSHNCSICAELRFHALTAPECFQILAEHFKRRIQVYCSVYLFQALRTWFVFLCRNVFDRILYQV